MFFLGSLGGLAVDVGGFAVLVTFGLPPAAANVVSSACSISVVYLLVTRFTFGAGARTSTYALFVAWYCANIAITSTFIALATTHVSAVPLLWKLITIPFSFTANFAFSRLLFRRLSPAVQPGTPPG